MVFSIAEARDLAFQTSACRRVVVTVGRLAQLVERLVYTEDVGSSSLSSPTIRGSTVSDNVGDSP